MKKNKPQTGYKKEKAKQKRAKDKWLSSLFLSKDLKKTSLMERVVKFLIYIALRLVIKPSKWIEHKQNYEIIDNTYKRIMSSDFIYIPSSIAFYLIISFMPILSLVMFVDSFDFFHKFIGDGIKNVLGRFIPGARDLLEQLRTATSGDLAANVQGRILIIVSLVVSIWIASGGFAKLIFTQSYIYNYKFVGGYWMNRLRGFTIAIFFTIFLSLALALNVYVERLISLGNFSRMLKDFLTNIFLIFGLFVLCFIGFGALYRYSPRFKTTWRNITPGAMSTTIPTVAFLVLFGLISSLWSYGSYGVVGAIMYVGMMALTITYFIFIGILVNAGYQNSFVGVVKKKWTISKK